MDFLARLSDVLAPSRTYKYDQWIDFDLILGLEWEEQINKAIDECDIGLLLISPAFLASSYIANNELPRFISGKKSSVPVMLQPVDFKLHDLKGLEKRQIFRFDNPEFTEPRAYGECSDDQREAYVLGLFRKIEEKLNRSFEQTPPEVEIDPLNDLRLLELASKAYRKRGTPKFFLDGQNLTQLQKAELYDRIVLEERGRPAKNNPYRVD
ncbi:MAG: toll/interleukin-1 receptor domain-containing protein [Proteobacteria bacterium]|nr:toll/interleukin-1 receptor domain-containing protein [Pseudomonadota bacterium]MCH8219830.1 toll/interleukin-1 receptor domain-containing protein [Pseudomonadota bacterium]